MITKYLKEILMNALYDNEIVKKFDSICWKNLNEFGYDAFGFNPDFVRKLIPFVTFFYKYYFRCECKGIENVPEGKVLLIANHSGSFPFDAAMIITSMIIDKNPPRMIHGMVERFAPTLPFFNFFMFRSGQVVGTPDNCQRLLEDDEGILVFPEGTAGITKNFSKRYQLQEFGNGFMRIALSTKTPIVPVALIGAEEQAPTLYNAKFIGKLFGFPAFPLTPTFPWIFPFGILPYPVKYRIYFGEPLFFKGDPEDDDEKISLKVKKVKSTIQAMIHKGLSERKHIFW